MIVVFIRLPATMGAFDAILGPILMGTIFTVLLHGIMIMQCYVYFQRFKQDRPRIKLVVGFLLLLDTMTCSFDIAMTYDYLVKDFGNASALAVVDVALRPFPATIAITAFIVQCFFGWRIQVISGNQKMISILIYSLSTVQLLGGIGAAIGGMILKEFMLFHKITAISLVWLLGSLLTDVVITCALVWYLHNGRTGISATDDTIDRLIRMTVQTGLLTTSCALVVVITHTAFKTSLIFMAFNLPLPKLYTISLLSTLNSRQGWFPPGQYTDDTLSTMGRRGTTIPYTGSRDGITRLDSLQRNLGSSVTNSPKVSELRGSSDLEQWRQDKTELA